MDIAAHPDHDRSVGGLGQDACQFAVSDQQVVRPLQIGAEAADLLAGPASGQAGRGGQQMPAGDREIGRAQQDRHQQGGARFGLPFPVQPAPPAVCNSAATTSPSAAPAAARAGHHPVGGVGDFEDLDVVEAAGGGQVSPDSLDTEHAVRMPPRAQQGRDRQPGRNRGPGHPHLPRTRHRQCGGVLGPRPGCPPRSPGRRGVRARRSDRGGELSRHREDPRHRGPVRRRWPSPRLRVLLRECRLCPSRHRGGTGLGGAPARSDRDHGRQDQLPTGGPTGQRRGSTRHDRDPPAPPTRSSRSARPRAGRSPSRPPTAGAVGACG